MTRRSLRSGRAVRTPLKASVEDALRLRLLGAAPGPAQQTADLFPQELESAIDNTVAEFRARNRDKTTA